MNAAARALDRYRPSPFPGKVTLFRSEKGRLAELFHEIQADSGWSELVSGGVEILSVPGDHESMLVEPHVSVVAETLRACLESAQLASGRQRQLPR